MTANTIGKKTALGVFRRFFCVVSGVLAQLAVDPTLPQNFTVSDLRPGPGRFQVTLIYEWGAGI